MPLNDLHNLEARLLAAHETSDTAALMRLYTQAVDLAEAEGRLDAACFYLTHAYVFALDIGATQASQLHQKLVTHGREE